MNRNPLQPLIINKFQSYIRTEYPRFYELMSEYYDWTDDRFLQHLSNHLIKAEVNSEYEHYVEKIMSELGWDFELPTPGDKRLITNTLKDLYLSKGNEYSFEYLFRSLFNEPVSIDYPRKRLFTASSAEYRNDNFVLISTTTLGSTAYQHITTVPENTLGITIHGYVSGVSENVNRIIPVVYNGMQYLLVSLDGNPDFRPFETVYIELDGVRIIEQIYNTARLDKITEPGYGYRRGDIIALEGFEIPGLARVVGITTGSIIDVDIEEGGSGYRVGEGIVTDGLVERGFGFFAQISSVDENGSITQVTISNGGYEYEEIPKLKVISESGEDAIIKPVPYKIGGISDIEFSEPFWKIGDGIEKLDNPEYFIVKIEDNAASDGSGATILFDTSHCVYESVKRFYSDLGVLGVNAIMHDSLYFQEYSYEVNSPVAPKLYQKALDEMVHPAGLVRYIIYNHDAPLNYNFNRLDYIKFSLNLPIDRFLSMTFDEEERHKNYHAVVEEIPDILLRNYASEEAEASLRIGLTFIRYPWLDVNNLRLSTQERIPGHVKWDTTCDIDDLKTGLTFIRQYEAFSTSIMTGMRIPQHGINSDMLNEVTLG